MWEPQIAKASVVHPPHGGGATGRTCATKTRLALSLVLLAAVGCGSSSDSGTAGTGGRPGSGGSPSGNAGSGGGTATGGTFAGSGGGTASGGSSSSGGGTGSGGTSATGGGAPASGGAVGSGGVGATSASGGAAGSGSGGAGNAGGAPLTTFAVVTNRYDNARSGSNPRETILNTSNVNAARFGLLFSRAITGYVYSQPLYVGGLTVNGAKHNVVYVVTEHNMIYAFDADSPTASAPLWSKSLGTSLTLGTGAGYDPGCSDMRNEVGITATPVISLADNKIYVVAKTSTDQQLHALDLATGDEGAGSPVSVGKTAMPALDVRVHLNRASLLLLNGVIYISFGSHCDSGAYHGWIFGYDTATLSMKTAFNSTPTGTKGAIWQSGTGPASDGTDLFLTVGNGDTGGNNLGNNVVRLTPAGGGLNIGARYQSRVNSDNDLQSGAVLLGSTGQVVGGGKDGVILLLGASDMSVKQMITIGGEANEFVYWNGSAGPTLFAWSTANNLRSYKVGAGTLTAGPQNSERNPGHPSAIFSVSSNGTQAGTGILWANVPITGDAWHATATGALYAFDAADVSKPSLWNSNLSAADNLGTYAKYSTPTVANGKVYVATFSDKLMVYGLK